MNGIRNRDDRQQASKDSCQHKYQDGRPKSLKSATLVLAFSFSSDQIPVENQPNNGSNYDSTKLYISKYN